VKEMTQLGIPVFNTPGANANAVKELVIAGMLLGSRRIVDGINHMKVLGASGQAKERVEKDKAMFGGQEISGKTLAVVGLGHIGSITALDAAALGMNVTGKVTTAFTFFFHFTARRLLEKITHFPMESLFVSSHILVSSYISQVTIQDSLSNQL
jgi:lactate dehydrogenase-like 2-hydroxyacid dehydrogenase